MNDDWPIGEDEADAHDSDPWTYFGAYADENITAVRNLLQEASITFHVIDEALPETLPAPHHLWVHDDHVGQAESILVPYIQSKDRNA